MSIDEFTIAHISDLHCGGPYFVPNLLERAIDEINELKPDVVVCSGDLTTFGFRPEYQQAREFLDTIECDSLVVIPGNHDSRNVVYDAGDAIECLQRAGVNLVLSGHKHVPYAWRLEDLFIVNAGTVSSLRLRGHTRPCYNVIEIAEGHVDVWRKYPYHDQEKIIQFSIETRSYEKYTDRIEREVRPA